jgi:hypothetical protein
MQVSWRHEHRAEDAGREGALNRRRSGRLPALARYSKGRTLHAVNTGQKQGCLPLITGKLRTFRIERRITLRSNFFVP